VNVDSEWGHFLFLLQMLYFDLRKFEKWQLNPLFLLNPGFFAS